MSDLDNKKDKFEGMVDEAKGGAKQDLGKLGNDNETEMDGKKDEMLGKAKQGVADAKDAIGDKVDEFKNKSKDM